MKLEEWQRVKLRELFRGYLNRDGVVYVDVLDEDELIGFVEQVLSGDAPKDAAGEVYTRFMREWKQVGVWAGGKPVRAKLARLLRDGKIDAVWAGLARLAADPNRPAPEFVPRPMTWLNQERWNDDPYPVRSGGRQAAAGAVLSIQLDPNGLGHIEPTPSILNEMKQGRW